MLLWHLIAIDVANPHRITPSETASEWLDHRYDPDRTTIATFRPRTTWSLQADFGDQIAKDHMKWPRTEETSGRLVGPRWPPCHLSEVAQPTHWAKEPGRSTQGLLRNRRLTSVDGTCRASWGDFSIEISPPRGERQTIPKQKTSQIPTAFEGDVGGDSGYLCETSLFLVAADAAVKSCLELKPQTESQLVHIEQEVEEATRWQIRVCSARKLI